MSHGRGTSVLLAPKQFNISISICSLAFAVDRKRVVLTINLVRHRSSRTLFFQLLSLWLLQMLMLMLMLLLLLLLLLMLIVCLILRLFLIIVIRLMIPS